MHDDAILMFIPIIGSIGFFWALVSITRIVSENRTKRKLLETHATDQVAAVLLAQPNRDPDTYGSLKWGLVITAIGAALVMVQLLDYAAYEPIVYGLMLLFAGVALLAYYAIVRKIANRPSDYSKP
jgi:hypothetical protein